MKKFPIYKQFDTMDCGPTCIRMIAKYHGKEYSPQFLRSLSSLTREGVSLLGICDAAERIGYRTLAVRTTVNKLIEDAPLPSILHWNQNHFVVLYKIKNNRFFLADPAEGKISMRREQFESNWVNNGGDSGVALLMDITQDFYNPDNIEPKFKEGFRFLFKYLKPYTWYVVQLFISLLIASGFSLIFPLLTQNMVDRGIHRSDISFVKLILISQVVLFAGSTAIEFIRGWILMHMNNRISISIISDFLIKLMKLPMQYFETIHLGDIKQRIADHQRIQSFLTGTTLSTLFSFVNLIVFSLILITYDVTIFIVFFSFSLLGIGWIVLFLKKRKQLDYVRFQQLSDRESILIELITGMQEIKLNNCERTKRWKWENVQASLYKLNMKSMALGQYQQIGSVSIHQLKNILVSYIAASEVIKEHLTLGMMMSVSYIIGQLNSPIQQLLGLVQGIQDTKISLDRLSEIHNRPNEETDNNSVKLQSISSDFDNSDNRSIINDQPNPALGIKLEGVSFQYNGPRSPYVLKDINLCIPKGKVTAIVGSSGSGKTTLLKLLLKFYDVSNGKITVDGTDINTISPAWWRSRCGTVMQEGFIFSDTIANNISITDEVINMGKLENAIRIANIKSFIEELPMELKTKIGLSGNGISVGQKQRILIARAVYKNPEYLFFDEATSSLDANNERTIMDNLQQFFHGKTVVIVAHRLSTVKNADQIIVLDNGGIAEVGNHSLLVAQQGKYYELIKNQLELGN